MLSAAKHLCAYRERPFAEFTLSEANGLRVTKLCRSWSLKFIMLLATYQLTIVMLIVALFHISELIDVLQAAKLPRVLRDW